MCKPLQEYAIYISSFVFSNMSVNKETRVKVNHYNTTIIARYETHDGYLRISNFENLGLIEENIEFPMLSNPVTVILLGLVLYKVRERVSRDVLIVFQVEDSSACKRR